MATPSDAILWPPIALAALTFIVMLRMYAIRISEMRSRKIGPQLLATSRDAAQQLQDTAAADNFRNLFELPVLFYLLCTLLYATDRVTTLQLALAWAFVASRVVHSAIHTTYNRVMHRFSAFIAGAFILLAMWIAFAVSLFR